MLIALGICLIYVQHTWCMLSALVEYMLCMFGMYSVCEVYVVYAMVCIYVVYVEYKWCTRVANSV